jgi:hypothetical protein
VIGLGPMRVAAGRPLLLLLVALAACHPSTIVDAEAKGDVKWLDANGTPDAVAAMGRLADKDPAAVTALEARSSWDVHAFKAAWSGVMRGASWGTKMLEDGLTDPARSDLAASGMDRHDAHLTPFVGDLEKALSRLSASMQNLNVSSTLASIGPPAHDAIQRRLADASTRGAMCRGIASHDADPDARKVLLGGPVTSRDHASCVDAIVIISTEDDEALAWMGERGEPGLIGAAGKTETLTCPRLHVAWTKALAARPADQYSALTVPLGSALKRCTAEMDGVLADGIAHMPAAHSVLLGAIDPFEGYGSKLHATCAALPLVAGSRDPEILKERARDALSHACKAQN